MKKTALLICFSACFSACFAQIKDPIIMSIGDNNVTKSEFEYIWKKNNTNTIQDSKSLNEYIDLFVNFKLKVAEAKAQGIDTTKAFINELNGYRQQLIAPYLTDKGAEDSLLNVEYDRFKKYVEVSHILVQVAPTATPKDTLAAWQKISGLYKRIQKGEDFGKLARENSDDGSKEDGGYLGFTTGLRWVYPFENVAFNTPVGKISKPFRTQFGYHIIKLHSSRPGNGQYRSGHILKLVPQNASPEVQAAAKDSIFKIYNALKNGESFEKYATEKSDDRGAAANKGEQGMRYCGTFPIEYEDAVYKLKIGEFSEPFQSKYGWHIVKALEFQPYPDIEKMRDELTRAMGRDERSQVGKKALAEKLKKEYNYTLHKENLAQLVKAFEAMSNPGDSTIFKNLSVSQAPLFTLNGVNFTQEQFATFLKNKGSHVSNVNEEYSSFVQQKVLAYEDSQLEKKYPEFGHLMQEYSDGILLFDVSNREVWEKASLDTAGLKTYFEANKAKYTWEKPHYKGFIIQCANANVAKKANKLIKKLPSDSISVVLKRTFNNDSTTLVKVDRGLYAQGDNSNIDFLAFKQGKLEPKKDFPEVFIKGYALNAPESYLDVRGLVISDYQNYLEERWIKSLKGKFLVNVDKDVVNTVNKN